MDANEWTSIEGYPNYEINSLGEIRSLKYLGWDKIKIMTPGERGGYKYIGLCRNGKRDFFKVHRLVAKTFIQNPDNKPQVNHINGIKTDNRFSNLEWCTNGENQLHAYANGLNKCTENHHFRTRNPSKGKHGIFNKGSKPIRQRDVYGNVIKDWVNGVEIEEVLGIGRGSISSCCNGKIKIAGGYKWEFINTALNNLNQGASTSSGITKQ